MNAVYVTIHSQIKAILNTIYGHTLGRNYINAVNVIRISHIIVLSLQMCEHTGESYMNSVNVGSVLSPNKTHWGSTIPM